MSEKAKVILGLMIVGWLAIAGGLYLFMTIVKAFG